MKTDVSHLFWNRFLPFSALDGTHAVYVYLLRAFVLEFRLLRDYYSEQRYYGSKNKEKRGYGYYLPLHFSTPKHIF